MLLKIQLFQVLKKILSFNYESLVEKPVEHKKKKQNL